jgi:hypothetical protein
MKYETPKLTALTPAIDAIQGTKEDIGVLDHPSTSPPREFGGGYADWE